MYYLCIIYNILRSYLEHYAYWNSESGGRSSYQMHNAYVVECNVNCHKKCQKFIPNLCGVNQKILAEQLSSIRLSQSSTKSHEQEVCDCHDLNNLN